MKIACNKPNLRKYAKVLLGANHSPEVERTLIDECLHGFIRNPGHISFDHAQHLERINYHLGTHGVEGILIDKHGNDMTGTCSESGVKWNIQYCNTGDSYAMTIMYVNGKLKIGDWGSIVELTT